MISWSLNEGSASLDLSCDPDADGDYLVTIKASVEGFTGHAGGHVVGRDWKSFIDALRLLEKNRKGEARLESAYLGQFELRVHSIDSKGHMGLSGSLRYKDTEWPHQFLRFAFEFDPSKLASFVRNLGSDE